MLSSPYILCPLLYLSLYLTYSHLSWKFDTERKKAYILSSISSLTMTLISIPFFLCYLFNGLEYTFKSAQSQSGWMGGLARFSAVFFGAYLFADLSIGYVKYRSQVGLLTGWIHHTVYIGLMYYILQTNITPVFTMGAIMELPTFDLAISNLFPKLRNDLRFLSTFFTFRILFHIIYLWDCAKPSSRVYIGDDTWVPTIMLSLALLMHISWFKGGVTGYLKRRRLSSREPAATVVFEQDPIVEWANSLDETISEQIVPSTETTTNTPNESPLLTPHTPSNSTPFLFPINIQNLPISNLSLPSISNLPSLSDITTSRIVESGSGFREAVKHRWDEQKGKFGTRSGLIKRNGGKRDGEGEEVVLVRDVEVE